MSPDLIAFLKAWHDWATNGAPDGDPFCRSTGLCPQADGDAYHDLRAIRKVEFSEGDWVYPFGGEDDYDRRASNGTQHECPARLAWVRAKLVEAGELVA